MPPKCQTVDAKDSGNSLSQIRKLWTESNQFANLEKVAF
jgi:hypothetical protein